MRCMTSAASTAGTCSHADHLQLLRHPQSMRLPQDGVRHAARAMNRRRACRRVPAALDLAGREGHLSQQKSWTRCMKPSRLWDWRGWANAERSEPVGARALRPPSHQHTQLMARNVCPDAHLRDDPAFIPEYDPITASARLGPRSSPAPGKRSVGRATPTKCAEPTVCRAKSSKTHHKP